MFSNKLITIFVFVLLFSFPKNVKADMLVAGVSASLKSSQVYEEKFDYRIYALRKFLSKHGSPLTPYSLNFIQLADYYDVDWRMVPAISGVESTFGKRIPANSYNAYGWANGRYAFNSWPESIDTVTKTLKLKYIDKGAVSISKIARIYAPPSKTWGGNVKFFIAKISPLPLSFDI